MKEIIFFCFKYLKINKFLLILLFLRGIQKNKPNDLKIQGLSRTMMPGVWCVGNL